jgi:four helix bundle protein
MARDYKKIIAWQRAHQLTLEVYQCTNGFPSDERFGLTIQLRRAAYSVPANIVEGTSRESHKDYLRFLTVSLGSLKEVEYFLLLSRDLKYLRSDDFGRITELVSSVMRPLQGLIRAVRKEMDKTHSHSPQTTDHRP